METFRKEIFEQLGKLFYALAVEENMSLIASGELKMAVRKDWLSGYPALQGTIPEAAHLIGVEIDTLLSDRAPSSAAFAAFETFFLHHEEQFSFALKEQILETAETIVNLLSGRRKRNERYERLKILLAGSMKGSAESKLITDQK
jgi:hypothetical protein